MRYINIWQPFVVRNIIYIYHLFYVAVIEKSDGVQWVMDGGDNELTGRFKWNSWWLRSS